MGFIEELKKPFNIVMLLLAIGSIIATTIFYFWSTKKLEFSYCIESTTKIFDSKLTDSKIKIVNEENIEITSDVYSTSILIWNSGDLPININDVRVSPSIIISGIDRLISIPTLKESEPLVTKFQLQEDTINNRYKLYWTYFDPNNALKINFLYTAENDNSFDVEIQGNVLGIDKFLKIELNPYSGKKWQIVVTFIGLILCMVTPIYFIVSSKKRIRYYNSISSEIGKEYETSTNKTITMMTILFVLYLLSIPYMIYIFFFNVPKIPIF